MDIEDKKLSIISNHCLSLKETSKYGKNKQNYMCQSMYEVCDFDNAKYSILDFLRNEMHSDKLKYQTHSLNLNGDGVKSVDAWFEYNNEKILLEFKSGENIQVSKKIYHTILFLSKFLNTGIDYFKEYIFVLVVNNDNYNDNCHYYDEIGVTNKLGPFCNILGKKSNQEFMPYGLGNIAKQQLFKKIRIICPNIIDA